MRRFFFFFSDNFDNNRSLRPTLQEYVLICFTSEKKSERKKKSWGTISIDAKYLQSKNKPRLNTFFI